MRKPWWRRNIAIALSVASPAMNPGHEEDRVVRGDHGGVPAYGSIARALRSALVRRISRPASTIVLVSRASARIPAGPSKPVGRRNEPSGEFTQRR